MRAYLSKYKLMNDDTSMRFDFENGIPYIRIFDKDYTTDVPMSLELICYTPLRNRLIDAFSKFSDNIHKGMDSSDVVISIMQKRIAIPMDMDMSDVPNKLVDITVGYSNNKVSMTFSYLDFNHEVRKEKYILNASNLVTTKSGLVVDPKSESMLDGIDYIINFLCDKFDIYQINSDRPTIDDEV